jgi:hypothetical protein
MFKTSFKDDDKTGNERMIAVRQGMLLVASIACGVKNCLDEEDAEIFTKASEICAPLRSKDLDLSDDNTEFFESLEEYPDDFMYYVQEQKRPFKWAIHESLIPAQLVVRGVLAHMTDCSTNPEEVNEKFLVVRMFKVDEEGISYCI